MGTTDYGSQEISFDYKTPGKSETFNKLNFEILPVGIYNGGLLTRIDTVTVQISQLTCFIEDTANDVAVRISTSTTINTTVAPSTPYLIVRFGWSNVENNYADIIAVDYASIDPKDIIIGRCAYDSGNNLLSTFDYSRRTISSLQDLDDKKDNLKAYPTESPSNVITVSAGEALILNDPYSFAGGNSPVISDTVAGRIDLIYLDENGLLNILEGTDSASPVQPDFPSRGFTIAKITRGASETVVRGDQIEMFEWDGIAGGAATTGGGSTSFDVTAGESIDAGEAVYFEDDGKVYLADNREFKKSIVHGIALQTGGADSTISISKLDSIPEYSGLTVGAERYLGHDGLNIALGSLDTSEYKVHLGTVTAVDTIKASVQLPEPTRNQDDGNPVGSIKYFSTYKDRSAYGYLPFAFDNAISQANYPVLFSEIGHIYEAQHLAAGDANVSTADILFYPTPVPGYYNRGGLPDIEFTNTDVYSNNSHLAIANLPNWTNNYRYGTAYKVIKIAGTLPTGLVDGDTYYTRFSVAGNNVIFYQTEKNALDDVNPIAYTDTGAGTFRLTQEGIVLDDAMQQITGTYSQYTAGGGVARSGAIMSGALYRGGSVGSSMITGTGGTGYSMEFDSANSPDARTSNETRPKTNYSFGYIKAEHVTSAGEPISALRYDTGWVNASSGWQNQDFTITHNLGDDLSNLIVKIFISSDGTEANAVEPKYVYRDTNNGTPLSFGMQIEQISQNVINIQTGAHGITLLDISGAYISIDTETTYYYKVVITKPNLINTVFDVSSMPKTYDLTSANVTVTLPVITGAMQTKSIYWTNGGTYKLSLAVTDAATVGGLTATTWEGEGEGHMVVESDGTNWQVREYEDSGGSSGNNWEKFASGKLVQEQSIVPIPGNTQANRTLPHAFISTDYRISLTPNVGSATSTYYILSYDIRDTTYVQVNNNYSASLGGHMITIGRWRA